MKQMATMIDAANQLISELGSLRELVGPLNIDECLSRSGDIRQALSSALEDLMHREFGSWSLQGRDDKSAEVDAPRQERAN